MEAREDAAAQMMDDGELGAEYSPDAPSRGSEESSFKRKMSGTYLEGEGADGASKKVKDQDACHRCGGTGHLAVKCTSPKGANELCHNCGGYGHMMHACPSPGGAKLACHTCSGKGHQVRARSTRGPR